MAGKFIFAALIGAAVGGSFYFFGDVQANPQARLALIGPVVAQEQPISTN